MKDDVYACAQVQTPLLVGTIEKAVEILVAREAAVSCFGLEAHIRSLCLHKLACFCIADIHRVGALCQILQLILATQRYIDLEARLKHLAVTMGRYLIGSHSRAPEDEFGHLAF